jgi:Lrp/AsnC family leucine-responsive transcriptional regulator
MPARACPTSPSWSGCQRPAWRNASAAWRTRASSAVIDPAALGLSLAAYLRIRPMPGQLRRVAEVLMQLPAVVECDRVTGEDCFIAKAYLRDVAELEALIDEIIPYAMTNTSIIQSSP